MEKPNPNKEDNITVCCLAIRSCRILSSINVIIQIIFTKSLKKKISWDQSLEDEDIETWKILTHQWLTQVMEIPRMVIDFARLQQLEIHVFTDASPTAYAAAVYVK